MYERLQVFTDAVAFVLAPAALKDVEVEDEGKLDR
jgi:hypothetical protein